MFCAAFLAKLCNNLSNILYSRDGQIAALLQISIDKLDMHFSRLDELFDQIMKQWVLSHVITMD